MKSVLYEVLKQVVTIFSKQVFQFYSKRLNTQKSDYFFEYLI